MKPLDDSNMNPYRHTINSQLSFCLSTDNMQNQALSGEKSSNLTLTNFHYSLSQQRRPYKTPANRQSQNLNSPMLPPVMKTGSFDRLPNMRAVYQNNSANRLSNPFDPRNPDLPFDYPRKAPQSSSRGIRYRKIVINPVQNNFYSKVTSENLKNAACQTEIKEYWSVPTQHELVWQSQTTQTLQHPTYETKTVQTICFNEPEEQLKNILVNQEV